MAQQEQLKPKRIVRVDTAAYPVIVPKEVNGNQLSQQLHARQGWTMEMGRAGIIATYTKTGFTLVVPYANVRYWVEE
ncbi:MAG TPA: hypothetical protein VMT56_00245 [Candidatus Bathyarchaeia archaeon]|nr:hypothetical protein [Candidatus Bathyarchaeia archaeon]